jgi:hypothetical protein
MREARSSDRPCPCAIAFVIRLALVAAIAKATGGITRADWPPRSLAHDYNRQFAGLAGDSVVA